MTETILTNCEELSFVAINGIGRDVDVQVTYDKYYFITSNYYKLTQLMATESLISSRLGGLFDISKINPHVYLALAKLIKERSEVENSRIKDNDPLLQVRAFVYLMNTLDIKNQDLVVSDVDLEKALNHAIEEDDFIKDYHYSIVLFMQNKGSAISG